MHTPHLVNSPEQPPRGVAAISRYVNTYRGTSAHPHDLKGVQTHRPKLFNSNWSSLKRVLDLILRLAREDGAESRSRINDWIAEQADSIIIKEMERTMCAFVASHDLTPEVLASDYFDARLDAIAEGNPLISGRVRTLLSQCGDPPPAEPINRDKDPTASTDVEMEEAT
ncbi:BZ3500_MvSof-1268-A1-R1_Chr12-2g03831 [Microbotryum saponariae]|uniref:BZ3500_MvSof-1268-A1-R1_Chr12-2g03831 protein n=1 Tax=Microbotryum saponariae TaxID=289078 RepID=A0A2X0MJD2_9BASI|nr:BZ3500_MvSof-1268-A1-R1_Chr12-2g03831 [Microbotryum saponariae]